MYETKSYQCSFVAFNRKDTGAHTRAKFSPQLQSKLLAVGNERSPSVKLFDLTTLPAPTLLRELTNEGFDSVHVVQFSLDGLLLVTSSWQFERERDSTIEFSPHAVMMK